MTEVMKYWCDSTELTNIETHNEPYCGPNADASLVVFAADFDAVKAGNARLSEVAAAEMKLREGNFDTITQLEAENARLLEVLENVQHGTVCPAQPGWLDAGPCTCGLAAALSPWEKRDE